MQALRQEDDEEYVDTSDAEEREVIDAVGRQPAQLPSWSDQYTGWHTPRKRRKLSHSHSHSHTHPSSITRQSITGGSPILALEEANSTVPPVPDLSMGDSLSPKSTSVLSTSGAFSSQGSVGLNGPSDTRIAEDGRSSPGNEGDFDPYVPLDYDICTRQDEPNEPVDLSGILGNEGSQDPLNLVSQNPLHSPVVPSHGSPALSPSKLPVASFYSLKNHSTPTLQLPNVHITPGKLGGRSPHTSISDTSVALGMYTPLSSRVHDHGGSQLTGRRPPSLSQSKARRHNPPSPLTPLPPSQTRYSSVPLASSPQSQSLSDRSPSLRARTLSPTPSSRTGPPQLHPVRPGEAAASSSDVPEADAWPEEEAPKRYSLRARQARQLNPYEYEKMLYKRQLRHNPDAIVKIVSPRRRQSGHGRAESGGGRGGSGGSQDDEWVAADGEGESQAQDTRRVRRDRQISARGDLSDGNQEQGGSGVSKWYPKDFDLSDDDLPNLPPLLHNLSRKDKNMEEHEKRRKVRKMRRFPLRDLHTRRSSSPEADHGKRKNDGDRSRLSLPRFVPPVPKSTLNTGASGIGDRASKQRSQSAAPHDSRPLSMGEEEPELDYDRLMDNDGAADFGAEDYSADLHSHREEVELDYGLLVEDDGPDFGAEGSVGVGSPNTSPRRSPRDDVVSVGSDQDGGLHTTGDDGSSSDSTSQSSDLGRDAKSDRRQEKEKKARKALKVLGRMMPAVMISKAFQKQAGPLTKANRARSASEERMHPGRSKIRRGFGETHGAVVEIKGDSESSESDHEQENSDSPGVLSSDGEREESADDDGTDDVIEASWFDNDFGHRYQNPSSSRKEDLIDRMLSRTGSGVSKPRRRLVSRPTRTSELGSTSRPKNPALDIVTSGSRKRNLQMKLPFHRVASTNGMPMGRHPMNRIFSRDIVDLTDSFDRDDHPGFNEYWVEPLEPIDKPKKSKKQRRKELIQKQTYLVPSDEKIVVTGRRRTIMSINVDDEGFHEALAPLQQDASGGLTRPRPRPKSSARSTESGRRVYRPTKVGIENHFDDSSEPAFELDDRSGPGPLIQTVLTRHSWEEPGVQKKVEKLTLDFDIPFLPSGLVFGPNTYLGRQLLHELLAFIAGEREASQPTAYSAFDINLHPDIENAEFLQTFQVASRLLCEWVESMSFDSSNNSEIKQYEDLMQAMCQFSVWLVTRADEQAKASVQTDILDQLRQFVNRIETQLQSSSPSKPAVDIRALSTRWFAVDLSSRILSTSKKLNMETGEDDWRRYTLLLMSSLSSFGLNLTLESIRCDADAHELNEPSTSLRTAELWICLIHLIPKISETTSPEPSDQHPFWRLLLRMFNEKFQQYQSDFEASEDTWRTIFGLSALSQFSTHGTSTLNPKLPACWDLTTFALKAIRLTSDPEVDQKLSRISLRKRDDYVRLVVARCYLLGHRWHWRLNDAYAMFNRLVEIFKSRKFANLRGEESDFPAFLRYSSLPLLADIRSSDTAFCLFLKLIVQAAKDDEKAQDHGPRSAPKLRKLLSLTVPLSGVPFSKLNPPIGQDLSMLYNRFSSIIIAILLEPTAANVKNRLVHARRYVNFSDADWRSKQACIRALMHTAILLRHLDLPLDEALKWLEEMVDTLYKEYREPDVAAQRVGQPSNGSCNIQDKNRATVCIQLLLGCVRRIIETPNMDPSVQAAPRYPDPALLDGPWVKQIFATKDLTSVVTTCLEIQKLVQTFLDVRSKVMPAPRRPALAPLFRPVAEESQDEFGQFDLDLDDPELIAALEKDLDNTPSNEIKIKDEKVAAIMDDHISPAIYRFVIKHFSDPAVNRPVHSRIEEYCHDADKWVDCWVGCAAVIVQNGRRDWSHYLSLGPQSWERISDASWRRRVGLRFMFRVLHSDPSAYVAYQDSFLEVLLESMATFKVTLENEYMSLLFSVDGLRHLMLRDLPVERESEAQDFRISRSYFTEIRLPVLDAVFTNMAAAMDRAAHGEAVLEYQVQKWVGFVLVMLSTMRDIYENLLPGEQKSYAELCRGVFGLVARHPAVQTQPRLAEFVGWGTGFEVGDH